MIKLRTYHSSDLRELYQLFYETVHRINCKDYTQSQVDVWAPKEPLPSLVGDLEKNFTCLAVLGDQIVGFVELTPEGLIKALYTHFEMQGRGIGRLLLESAFEEAQRLGINELYLESSLTARPFYEKMGFMVKEERSKDVRGECFDIIIMTRHL